MTKKLNEQAIQNELEQSAFFREIKSLDSSVDDNSHSKPSPSLSTNEPAIDANNDETKHRTPERSNERTEERIKIRHTFDIYEDQLVALHTLQLISLQTKNFKPKLGELVQDALDKYLASQEPDYERSNEQTNKRENEQI